MLDWCNPRLLVVADLPPEELIRCLQKEGYHVTGVSTVAAALTLLKSAAVDLVIVQSQPAPATASGQQSIYPPADPRSMVIELRGDPCCAEIPILVSAAQWADVVAILESGADDVVLITSGHLALTTSVRAQLTRSRLSEELREGHERGKSQPETGNEVVWDWNPGTGQLHMSETWGTLTGAPRDCQHGRLGDWLDRVHPADLLALRDAISEQCQNPRTYFLNEHRLLHVSGAWRWVRVRGTTARDAEGNVMCLAGSMADITATKVADSLTGLANPLHFLEHLSLAIESSTGSGFQPCVLFVDLDRFKNGNDSLGHLAGDQLLAEVADRLRSTLRAGDVVSRDQNRICMARFGGDEFVVLVHGLRNSQEAGPIAQRILDAVAVPFVLGGRTVYMTASVYDGQHWHRRLEPVLPHALRSPARRRHGNVSGQARRQESVRNFRGCASGASRSPVELRKRAAPRCRRTGIFARLAADRRSGWRGVAAVEVLLRWPGFLLGECRLEEVIQVAEETGLILELGHWVLENACRQMVLLRQSAPRLRNLTLNVNVSAKQLLAPQFYEGVMAVLRSTGLPPDALELEVTESVMLADASQALEVLHRLKCASVRLGIDDFGTSFSALSYLHQFPFDTLKLDRSFLNRSNHKGRTFEVVRAVIQLAHALGLHVVAEGI